MKTLRQLINNTPKPVIERSRRTTATVMNVKINKVLNSVAFTVLCRAHTEANAYEVKLELYPTEIHKDVFNQPSFDCPVWVTCGCPYWYYFCQYAVAKTGSTSLDQHHSDSERNDSKRPMVRNPSETPYLCKHLYAAAPQVVKLSLKKAKDQEKFEFT